MVVVDDDIRNQVRSGRGGRRRQSSPGPLQGGCVSRAVNLAILGYLGSEDQMPQYIGRRGGGERRQRVGFLDPLKKGKSDGEDEMSVFCQAR